MRLIQIAGKGRAGKTTVANMISKYAFNMGYIPVIVPFAGAIKELAAKANLTKESNSAEYRKYCQQLGEEKRKEDCDYWVTRTFEKIQEYMVKELDNKSEGKKFWEFVIIQDDVRYTNEVALGKELAAIQIFIDPGHRELEEHNAPWREHESESLATLVEASLNLPKSEYEDMFDIFLDNSDSLVTLEEDIKDSLKLWLEIGYLDLEEYSEETN